MTKLALAAFLCASLATYICVIAVDHNPQGEFWTVGFDDVRRYEWPRLAGLWLSWFVLTFACAWIGALLVRKLSR